MLTQLAGIEIIVRCCCARLNKKIIHVVGVVLRTSALKRALILN
jgi:hypothetical protein